MTIYTVPLIKKIDNWIFKETFNTILFYAFFIYLAYLFSPENRSYDLKEYFMIFTLVAIIGNIVLHLIYVLKAFIKAGRLNFFMFGLRKPIIMLNKKSFNIIEKNIVILYGDVLKIELIDSNDSESDILIIHKKGENYFNGAEVTHVILESLKERVFNEKN